MCTHRIKMSQLLQIKLRQLLHGQSFVSSLPKGLIFDHHVTFAGVLTRKAGLTTNV